MFIRQATYLSSQDTSGSLDQVRLSENNILKISGTATYEGVPLNVLRRMGRAVKMGVGVSLPLIKNAPRVDGIITGTANGGLEDCFHFLQQVLEYNEGTLTPTGFVQSTSNAIASQIGLLTANNGYNVTHVHRGHAFENAMLDALMFLKEQPESVFLLLGVEEISDYNYNLLYNDGWYKKEQVLNTGLYDTDSPGSIAGEGAAAFIVSNEEEQALAEVAGLKMLVSTEETEVAAALEAFIQQHAASGPVDLFLSGENGDNRQTGFYNRCYAVLPESTGVARFKHFTGEYPTVGSGALWLATRFLASQPIAAHFIKKGPAANPIRQVLIYNNFNGYQHSFILVKACKK